MSAATVSRPARHAQRTIQSPGFRVLRGGCAADRGRTWATTLARAAGMWRRRLGFAAQGTPGWLLLQLPVQRLELALQGAGGARDVR